MPQALEFFVGGGALYSTGRDYLTFLRMLLANDPLKQHIYPRSHVTVAR